jgi:predicted patatin/cPLA2 family phospholipase
MQKKLDIILDGGFFNGSYLIGALFFLKELEKRKYIKIGKVSGCSIGAITGLLYLMDDLDISHELYNLTIKTFKEKHNLSGLNFALERIKERLDKDLYKKISGKLFISYHNIEKRKKIVKSKFRDNNDLMECIKRSSFVPFMIDGEFNYKNKYFDGIFPHIFSLDKKKENKNILETKKSKTLYLDLLGSDKMKYLLSLKNESSNYHRILSGILDIHLFFIKENNTKMCSYVEDWGIINVLQQRVKKTIIEIIIFWFVYSIYLVKKYLPLEIYNTNIIFKILKKIIADVYVIIIENYCF